MIEQKCFLFFVSVGDHVISRFHDENVMKATPFYKQNNNYALATLFGTFLPIMLNYDVKFPYCTFYGGQKHDDDFLGLALDNVTLLDISSELKKSQRTLRKNVAVAVNVAVVRAYEY